MNNMERNNLEENVVKENDNDSGKDMRKSPVNELLMIEEGEKFEEKMVNDSGNDRGKRLRKSRVNELFGSKLEIEVNTRQKIFTPGSGVSLGEVERFQLLLKRGKIPKYILKLLHNLCYRTLGNKKNRNRNIKDFTGFENETDEGIEKRITFLKKYNVADLKLVCDMFSLGPKLRLKQDMIEAIISYFKKPCSISSMVYHTDKFKIKKRPALKKVKEKKSKSAIKKTTKQSEDKLIEVDLTTEKDEPSEEIQLKKNSRKVKREKENTIKKTTKQSKDKVTIKRVNEITTEDESTEEIQPKRSSTSSKRRIIESDSSFDNDENSEKKRKSPNKVKKKSSISSKKRIIESDSSLDNDENSEKKRKSPNKVKKDKSVEQDEENKETVIEVEQVSDDKINPVITEILSQSDLSKVTLNVVCDEVVKKFEPKYDLSLSRDRIKQLVRTILETPDE